MNNDVLFIEGIEQDIFVLLRVPDTRMHAIDTFAPHVLVFGQQVSVCNTSGPNTGLISSHVIGACACTGEFKGDACQYHPVLTCYE